MVDTPKVTVERTKPENLRLDEFAGVTITGGSEKAPTVDKYAALDKLANSNPITAAGRALAEMVVAPLPNAKEAAAAQDLTKGASVAGAVTGDKIYNENVDALYVEGDSSGIVRIDPKSLKVPGTLVIDYVPMGGKAYSGQVTASMERDGAGTDERQFFTFRASVPPEDGQEKWPVRDQYFEVKTSGGQPITKVVFVDTSKQTVLSTAIAADGHFAPSTMTAAFKKAKEGAYTQSEDTKNTEVVAAVTKVLTAHVPKPSPEDQQALKAVLERLNQSPLGASLKGLQDNPALRADGLELERELQDVARVMKKMAAHAAPEVMKNPALLEAAATTIVRKEEVGREAQEIVASAASGDAKSLAGNLGDLLTLLGVPEKAGSNGETVPAQKTGPAGKRDQGGNTPP